MILKHASGQKQDKTQFTGSTTNNICYEPYIMKSADNTTSCFFQIHITATTNISLNFI